MIKKSYQRRHLRAPFREHVLYTDGAYIQKALSLNLSEGGLLIDELPSFPETDEVSVLMQIPQLPSFKNFTLLKMQTFSKELFLRQVVRVTAKMVRRDELSQNLDNIFRSKFGLQFVKISDPHQKIIADYVTTFSANLVYLQTLIDSFNSDDEVKQRTRSLAKILGYTELEKISLLRNQVSSDYKSLQWL